MDFMKYKLDINFVGMAKNELHCEVKNAYVIVKFLSKSEFMGLQKIVLFCTRHEVK